MSEDKKLEYEVIPLNGKYRLSLDGTQLEKGDFQTLTNMRYTDAGIKSITGMTKINTSVINATNLKTRAAHHFNKSNPAESNVLVQSWNTGLTSGAVYKNATAIPSAGNFTATAVFSDSSGAGYGKFSDAPDGCVVYCNGKDAAVWGGTEYRCAGLVVGDLTGTVLYDYSDIINNGLSDANNVASLNAAATGGGIDSSTMLMLHLENNVTDSSPTTPHTVTNNNVTYSTSPKFGTYCGSFNGTTAYLTVPDNADFNLSGGTLTYDKWIYLDSDGGSTQGLYFQGTETLDTDKVTNGVFAADTDWTKGANWSIAAGVALHSTGSVETLSQDISAVAAEKYKVTFTIVGRTTGSVTVSVGGVAGTARDVDATYTEYITATGTGNLIFTPTTDFNGAIDDVVVQKVLDQNYMALTIEKSGSTFGVKLSIDASGSEVVALATPTSIMSSGAWYHVQLVKNSNDYYVFINGSQAAYVSDAQGPANYTGLVYIGCTGHIAVAANFFKGKMDEIRLSNVARNTTNFTPPLIAYATGSATTSYVYVGSTRPIQGAKFYVGTANATTASVTGYYWSSNQWNTVSSLSDGTSTTNKTLAKTGTISFTSTVATAKIKSYNKTVLYWYLFVFSGIDSATTIYRVTLDAPMQQIVDLWNGVPRTIIAGLLQKTNTEDNTLNLLKYDYYSADSSTYMDASSITSAQYIFIGFGERMTGIDFSVVVGKGNSNAAAMTVSYWSGAAWTSVGIISDGTLSGSNSLAQSGTVTWESPSEISEFRTSISNGPMLYFYRISFNATLSTNVLLDYVTGITAQQTIRGYKLPVYWQNNLCLCSETDGAKNKILIAAAETVCVFNGENYAEVYLGDDSELTAGGSLFSRFGGDLYEDMVITKSSEVWLLSGTGTTDLKKYRIAGSYGCVAPDTFKKCDLGYEIAPGINKHVLIWQSATSVVLFDGSSIMPITRDDDVGKYFDKNYSSCINNGMLNKSSGFFDERKKEYHWLFASASNTTLDKELVYDLIRKKWYEVSRGTGKAIQYGVPVRDTYGDKYTYGFLDTGYMERLEYGTTFDSTNITSTHKTSDYALKGMMVETEIRKVKHITVAKSNTSQTVSMTHYGDTASSGDTAETFSVNSSTKRVVDVVKSVKWGANVFHSFQCSIETSDENTGYEPIAIAVLYRSVRTDIL